MTTKEEVLGYTFRWPAAMLTELKLHHRQTYPEHGQSFNVWAGHELLNAQRQRATVRHLMFPSLAEMEE